MEIYIVCPSIMWRVYNRSLSPDFVCFRPWFGHGTQTSPLNGFWPKIFVWLWIYTEAGRASCWVMRSSHSSSWGDFNKDFFKKLSSIIEPVQCLLILIHWGYLTFQNNSIQDSYRCYSHCCLLTVVSRPGLKSFRGKTSRTRIHWIIYTTGLEF